MDHEIVSALTQISGTLVGGIISAAVAFFTIKASMGNQLALEAKKFDYQRQLENEKRDHEASAFRRKALLHFRRLHNQTRMESRGRISVASWRSTTREIEALLGTEACEKSLTDWQYDAAWRACDESSAAIMFLEIWSADTTNARTATFALASLGEYCKALERCFAALGDTERASEVATKTESDFKGVGFWMGTYEAPALYPNPA